MSRTGASARAAVLEGPRQLIVRELPLPEVGEDDAILRVEACGLCGTDLDQFKGGFSNGYPVVPGHEVIGTIAQIGPTAATRWGVAAGDRVAVEPRILCHRCKNCFKGRPCLTYPNLDRVYGYVPTVVEPGLWGGYSEYMYLHPETDLHVVAKSLSPEHAVLFNPMANGIEWSVAVPQPQFGDTVVVLGCGQRGLASVIALRARGIQNIVLTGLTKDEHKLALGEKFGATVVRVDREDLLSVVADVSEGELAAVVVDTTPGVSRPINDAVEVAQHGARIVLCGMKHEPINGLDSYKIIMKDLTIKCGVAASHDSYAQAVVMVSSHLDQVAQLQTHRFPLEEAEHGISLLSGDDPAEAAISLALIP